MRRAKTTYTPYFPDTGELIWLCWDSGADLLPHSRGLKPVLVLSSRRLQEQAGTVTVVPVLGSGSYCEGALALPGNMYTFGYIKLCAPEIVECSGDQVALIEVCPTYFVERIRQAVDDLV